MGEHMSDLADYVRHRDSSETISRQLAEFRIEWLAFPDGLGRFDLLTRVRDRETRAAASALARLRSTSSSSAWAS